MNVFLSANRREIFTQNAGNAHNLILNIAWDPFAACFMIDTHGILSCSHTNINRSDKFHC